MHRAGMLPQTQSSQLKKLHQIINRTLPMRVKYNFQEYQPTHNQNHQTSSGYHCKPKSKCRKTSTRAEIIPTSSTYWMDQTINSILISPNGLGMLRRIQNFVKDFNWISILWGREVSRVMVTNLRCPLIRRQMAFQMTIRMLEWAEMHREGVWKTII